MLATDLALVPSAPGLLRGVRAQERLAVVDALGVVGHADDQDLDAIVETVALALDVPLAVVNLVRPDLQTYAAEIGVGVACTQVPDRLSFCAEVVETGRPLQVADARRHAVYRENPLVLTGGVTAYAGVPLFHRGAVIGAVSVFDPRPRRFDARALRLLDAQARLASSVLTLRWAATHDALTGLANRRRAAACAATAPGTVSLLFLDVDDFKSVNDTHGHAHGDVVLKSLAEVLRQLVAGTAQLPVRWGGDEFLVLLPETDAAGALAVAERLVAAVGQDPSAPDSVTVGVATAQEDDSWDDLLRRAAGAAAVGKRTGKGSTTAAPPARATADRLRSAC